jgi:uncharacterized protein YkwD
MPISFRAVTITPVGLAAHPSYHPAMGDRQRRSVKLAAAASMMLCLAAVASGTGMATAVIGPGSAPTAVPAVRAAGIDTSNKAAVNRAYRRDYARNLATPVRWSGSNKGCHPGHISRKARQATLQSLNFVRAMGQLGPVSFATKLSTEAQQAALMMSANNALDHFPPKSWKCWTKSGADGAGHSDLAFEFPSLSAGETIGLYMADDGESNIFVGHRRWLLYPPATKMGDGATNVTNALFVVGPTSAAQPEPAWVPWPTAGWFPSPLEPAGRWSLGASDPATDFSHAHIRVVSAAGKVLHVHRYPVENGYGDPTVVWHVTGIRASGHYRVTMSKIRFADRKGSFSHSYRVHLFNPTK